MKTKTIILLPVLALTLAALAGCGQKSENTPSDMATNSMSGQNAPPTVASTNLPSSTSATTNLPPAP